MPQCDLTEYSDEELMQSVVAGRHDAFAVLVTRHTDCFYGLAYKTLLNYADAHDAVQSAFIKLWQNPAAFNPKKNAKFKTWFYRVVLNVVLDVHRRRKRAGVTVALDKVELYLAQPAQDGQDKEKQLNRIDKALAQLPDRQRIALVLCYYEGISNKQAARIMDVKLKALESLLMRGKARLKMLINKNDDKIPKKAGGS